MQKEKRMIRITESEYRRLKRVDERQSKLKPLVLQVASYFRMKKVAK